MKKTIALMLAIMMCLSLVACGGNIDASDANDKNDTHQYGSFCENAQFGYAIFYAQICCVKT